MPIDLREERSTATSIMRGVPDGSKYVGMYYVVNYKAHVVESCTRGNQSRVAVVEREGQLYSVNSAEMGSDQEVELCMECADLDDLDISWREDGACFGINDPGFFSLAHQSFERVIREYCEQCPVQRECLDYGAKMSKAHIGSVWGGVYFVKNNVARREAIDDKRRELDKA